MVSPMENMVNCGRPGIIQKEVDSPHLIIQVFKQELLREKFLL